MDPVVIDINEPLGCGDMMKMEYGMVKGRPLPAQPDNYYNYVYRGDRNGEMKMYRQIPEEDFQWDDEVIYLTEEVVVTLTFGEILNHIKGVIGENKIVCIEVEMFGDNQSHCFVLKSAKNGKVNIVDAYYGVRGRNKRPFDFDEFQRLLLNPNVEDYNLMFMCNDDEEDTQYCKQMGVKISYFW